MNVQHNCHQNHCTDSGHENVLQERQPTNVRRRAIVHSNTTDLILNTAQMRDTVWMGPLRQSIRAAAAHEVLETSIYQGVQAEIDKRKELGTPGNEDSPRGRGRGQRGRGGGRRGRRVSRT